MKISVFVIGFVFALVVLSSIGALIGVNDINNIGNDSYSDSFRSIFGGVNESDVINSYSDVTNIESTSGEDGTFQEYKVGTKVDVTGAMTLTQAKSFITNFFDIIGLSLIKRLIIFLLTAGVIFSGISFVRRYKA